MRVALTLILLLLLVGAALSAKDIANFKWTPFNLDNRISKEVCKEERFYVSYPCDESIKYKLFMKSESGAVIGHVELNKKVTSTSSLTGNLYCKGAGARKVWDGAVYSFIIGCNRLKCGETDGMKVLEVEKTKESIKIVDGHTGEVLWSKTLSERDDGDCNLPARSIITQVWSYTGDNLRLAIPGCDNEEEEEEEEKEEEKEKEKDFNWTSFNLNNKISKDLCQEEDAETFYVRYLCTETTRYNYKLSMNTESGDLLGYLWLYKKGTPDHQLAGNLYCKGAGSKSYNGGQINIFNLGSLSCGDDGMKVLKVEKGKYSLKLIDANNGKVLWSKGLSETDADCNLHIKSVSTEASSYSGDDLQLAAPKCQKEDGEEEENDDDKENDDGEEESDDEKDGECKWKMMPKLKLKGSLSGLDYNKDVAMEKCKMEKKCTGITCKKEKCMLNGSKKGKSHKKFTAYYKIC